MNEIQNKQEITTSRYSDRELEEFRELIVNKISAAKAELENLIASMGNHNSNGTEDTSAAYSTLEDGAATLEKETMHQMAGRQKKFIEQLEAALIRIEHKTYGICRVTGKLIPKERMRAVPHTTMSMEAKMRQN